MIAKIQKSLLWLFGAMFLVPEILWSPVSNFIYIFIDNSDPAKPLRLNFLTEGNPTNLYRTIVFMQLAGLFSFLFLLIKNKRGLFRGWLFYILLLIDITLILLTLFVFYLITFFHINFG
ncbi:MAG: hypothetical protein A2312_01520 [Candidatus Staskawiczbacteria bacterium RIFOXYB2_FULL_32_9]|uniref:Uncharacterized protein n=1 Tax=Candidatus Staskawiczbacteria bacterium RIFOXYD1_FULL_32_13 TaxID=1802234 RepID=A0A1G2JPL7_9BACT|nr:MAG: hypothetical protein UR22_C0007G0020 [Parcubacteria group bacterium GW2011_GWC2_32_10]OGZ79958.1 MAG: hypothetical protein A2360_03330 [Candidatus Staskawiczbacteria bacterium RIFOXYB1_FULL_32_11]OGZ83420.1 MAG: hypothetical protein A2312_01520 [Candidatus Staskawiczbacteria bacterium RIFOXYB2_FULL_32_9]OGZ89059.1 MAG: hypothetical protein A2561_05430 [Candidatus Staskawiczbacteria bacterium RIFOXYD1_FULL_32_13]